MNGQCQETAAISMSIPEARKHRIMVVLAQMISHSLTETGSQEEEQTSKDREDAVMMKHEVINRKSPSLWKAWGCCLQ